MSPAGLISVFGIAFFSLWASIPAGMALGLNPAAIVITAAASYMCGVGLVVVVGQPVRDWILRRLGDRAKLRPNSTIGKVWERYGLWGLALLAPVTTGAPIGAIIGMSLNAPPRRLFVLMSLAGVLWAVIFSALISLGITAVGR